MVNLEFTNTCDKRLFFKYDNLSNIPTNGIARYKNGKLEIEYGYLPLEYGSLQENLEEVLLKDGTNFDGIDVYVYEKERYAKIQFRYYDNSPVWYKILPIVWTVDMENQIVVADDCLDSRFRLCSIETLNKVFKGLQTQEVKLSDVKTDDFKYPSILEKEDYSYDKSLLFKTRIYIINNGRLYMRDLIKLSEEKIKEMLNYSDQEKVLSWKNKSILPPEEEYIQIGTKSYKLYIDDNFITELNNIEDLRVSNFSVQYKDKMLYNYKNLTEDNYNSIYYFVYNFLITHSYLKNDNNFKYMLNKQIDIRNNILNENKDINSDIYDAVAEIVHQRLQSKFISGQIDVKEYNNYFEKVMNTELSKQENNTSSIETIPSIDFLLNHSGKENIANITTFLFNIDIMVDQSTKIYVNGEEKYVLPYPCHVKQLNNSHYELSYEFIKYDLYVGEYLVYLNEQLIATYNNLGERELECIKNMANVISVKYSASPHGLSYHQLEDYQYVFKRLAREKAIDKCYEKEKIKK